MAVITLTSDFGLKDYRVAAIKGAILSHKLDIPIADISHHISAYNLIETAYIVRNAYKYFPKESVHIIAVDSFYKKEIRNLIYKADDHYFIASDNGILSLIFNDIAPDSVHEITLVRFDDEVHFAPTEIFVPAAVHLLNGGHPDIIGRIIDNPKEILFPRAVFNNSGNILVGQAMYIDNFGNVVFNISKKFFKKCFINYTSFTLKFRNLSLGFIYKDRMEVVKDYEKEREYHGKAMAIFNEENLLEICIYKGSKDNGARSLLGLSVGEKIYVEFQK